MTPIALGLAAIAAVAGIAVGREWERRTTSVPNEGRIRSLIEYRVAIHESGHAVCAWFSPYTTEIERITIDAGSIGEGHVRYSRKAAATAPVWWNDITISLGGIAAELEEFGKIRSGGAKKDLEKARDQARTLVRGGHMKPPWSTPFKLPDKFFDVSKTLRSINSGTDEAFILNLCLERAKMLVSRHRKRLLLIAKELAEKGDLNPADVKRLFGSRFRLFFG